METLQQPQLVNHQQQPELVYQQQQQPVYQQQQQQQPVYQQQQQQPNINVINIAQSNNQTSVQSTGTPKVSSGTKVLAVLVNMFLFPGLGQLFKGEVAKGFLFMTIWIVIGVTTILTIPIGVGFILMFALPIVWIWFVVDAAI